MTYHKPRKLLYVKLFEVVMYIDHKKELINSLGLHQHHLPMIASSTSFLASSNILTLSRCSRCVTWTRPTSGLLTNVIARRLSVSFASKCLRHNTCHDTWWWYKDRIQSNKMKSDQTQTQNVKWKKKHKIHSAIKYILSRRAGHTRKRSWWKSFWSSLITGQSYCLLS